jgi:hypothetical protein
MSINKVGMILLFALISCRQKEKKAKILSQYFNEHQYLTRYDYDINGKLVKKKSFNSDTIPNGEEVDFYENKVVEKWAWFYFSNTNNQLDKYPLCYFYYSPYGVYEGFKGSPFIRALKIRNDALGIELAKPPQIDFMVEYRDSFNNQLVHKIEIEPGETDSTAWVTLEKEQHKFTANHTYWLYYWILNKNKKRIDSVVINLVK